MSLINYAYQAVQTILNKNSRGVLTPERFNTLAKQAQIRYFSNLSNEYRDALNKLKLRRGGIEFQALEEELIRYMEDYSIGSTGNPVSGFTMPSDFAFFTKTPIFYNETEVAQIPLGEYGYYKAGIVAPSTTYPQYKKVGTTISLYPSLEDNLLDVFYYRNPLTPKWTYNTVGGSPLFNPSAVDYQDLDIPEHRVDDLIIDILELSGLHLRDQMPVQVAEALKNANYTQDKS